MLCELPKIYVGLLDINQTITNTKDENKIIDIVVPFPNSDSTSTFPLWL